MSTHQRKRRAGIYVRISDDRAGDAKGVERQQKDCRAICAREGWDVAEVYIENDTSAFKRRKVKLPDGTTAMRVIRPAFRTMLEDLQSGHIDALVVYDIDRMCRDPRDLEDTIDVIEATKADTRAATGELDLTTSQGRAVARVMVAFAQKSSEDTRRRVARKHEELAEAGKFSGGGHRPFGYKDDRLTVNPVEAKLVKKIAKMVLDGTSLLGVAAWLDQQGVRPVLGGKTWNPRSVHSILSSPRIAGYRTFRGEIVGRGEWPAIITKEQWDKLQIKLSANRAGRQGQSTLRYWLAGVLWCSKCGNVMTSNAGSRPAFWCSSQRAFRNYNGGEQVRGCGGIRISAPRVQGYVETVLLNYLQRPDVLKRLQSSTDGKAVERARKEAAKDQAQLLELSALWSSRKISTPEYLHARKEIDERLAQWDTLQQAALPASVRRIATGDVETIWAGLEDSPAERREIVRALWPSGILIMPFQGHRNVFDPARIVFLDWAHPEHQGRPPLTFPVPLTDPAVPPKGRPREGASDGTVGQRAAKAAPSPGVRRVPAVAEGPRPQRGGAGGKGRAAADAAAGGGRRADALARSPRQVAKTAGRSS